MITFIVYITLICLIGYVINRFVTDRGLNILLVDDLPIVKIIQEDREFYFLLDTGANWSYIDINTLVKLRARSSDISKGSTFTGAAASGISDIKGWVNIIFNIEDYKFSEDFAVINLNKEYDSEYIISGVLGTSFIKKYGKNINLDKLTLTIK